MAACKQVSVRRAPIRATSRWTSVFWWMDQRARPHIFLNHADREHAIVGNQVISRTVARAHPQKQDKISTYVDLSIVPFMIQKLFAEPRQKW